MEDSGDSNAKVLRVRALLKRGGKTPTLNTIVRTENVVATSADLQRLSTDTRDAHAKLADGISDATAKGVVQAIGVVRASVGDSYGLSRAGRGFPDDTAIDPIEGWPPKYAVDACSNLAVHASRLAALCHSFAAEHRKEANVENDVGHAICDTVTHLHEAYAQVDDEVFSKGEHPEDMEIAARIMNRRGGQLAERAIIDAHGEVFASVEFEAVRTSFVRAAAIFNSLHVGHSLYSGVPVHNRLPEFSQNTVAMESHLLLAEVLRNAGMTESAVTNTLARASRHAETAEAILEVEDARDPLADARANSVTGQPLRLGEWASEAMRTGVAQFDVIGGFSMSLEGNMAMHDGDLAAADWLCLRARTTNPVSGKFDQPVVASTLATAAWRRMRYDAGTYDAPFFRPNEQQLRAASRVGIALCGRGNLDSESHYADADLLVVDVGVAPEMLGMIVVGNYVPARATFHKAADAIGYMFSELELDQAADSVDAAPRPGQRAFLDDAMHAEPASWTPDPVYEETLPEEAAAVVSAPLESVPETTITAHEAFEHALNKSLTTTPVASDADASSGTAFPDADATTLALRAALCVTIRESPCALDDLAMRVTRAAHPGYTAGLPVTGHNPAAHALAPSVQLYRMLGHKGERAVDVAASILGLRELEPVVAELEDALDEEFEDALVEPVGSAPVVDPTESGTPSSEEFDELA